MITNSNIKLIGIPFCPFEIDHNTILQRIFDPLRESHLMDKKFLSCLVLEFFLIVKRMKIPMEVSCFLFFSFCFFLN